MLYTVLLSQATVDAASAANLLKALDKRGCLKKELEVAGVVLPKGAQLRAAASKRMDPRADLRTHRTLSEQFTDCSSV